MLKNYQFCSVLYQSSVNKWWKGYKEKTILIFNTNVDRNQWLKC